MNIFELRMRLAALKQLLRDSAERLTSEQVDKILDQINILTTLIEELEKKQ